MRKRTQQICVSAVGVALFAALSLCLQVPVFDNYYLCLGYAVMAVWCYSFGGLSGTLTGVLGVVLYCLLINGLRGMPGWALGNAVIGLTLGFVFRFARRLKNGAVRSLINAAAVITAAALGILIVKSLTECLLYSQPMAVRIARNFTAFIADAVMLLVSLPLCMRLHGTVKKRFPLLAVD